ncbi:MAG: TRAP transporter small permease [Cyclobacteriaceae bacterium]
MKIRKRIDRILGQFLAALMAIMAVNVLWQVFTRYVMNSPSSFTDELARFLLIWVGVLGAAYVAGKNSHIAIDIIPSRMTPSRQRKLARVIHVIVLLFVLVSFVIGGSRLVLITWEQTSPALQLSLGIVYLVIPISGLLILYYKLTDLIRS